MPADTFPQTKFFFYLFIAASALFGMFLPHANAATIHRTYGAFQRHTEVFDFGKSVGAPQMNYSWSWNFEDGGSAGTFGGSGVLNAGQTVVSGASKDDGCGTRDHCQVYSFTFQVYSSSWDGQRLTLDWSATTDRDLGTSVTVDVTPSGDFSCNANQTPSLNFSWQNTVGDLVCTSAELLVNNNVVARDLACTGAYNWTAPSEGTPYNYEIRAETGTKLESYTTCDTVCDKSNCYGHSIPDNAVNISFDGGLCYGYDISVPISYQSGTGPVITGGSVFAPVCKAPTVDLKANSSDGPLTVDPGTLNLNWTTTGFQPVCSASWDQGTTKPASGSDAVTIPAGAFNSFTLSCINAAGGGGDQVSVIANPPLTVFLSSSPSQGPVDPNQPVTWTAHAVGGRGAGSYTYSWSGTEDLTGSSQSVTKSYSAAAPQTKTATVTVTSGSQSQPASANIGVVNALGVNVTVSPPNPSVGDQVTFTANASGGRGAGSYTYSWSGADQLSGSSASITKTYTTHGSKTWNIAVTSGSQTANASGAVNVTSLPITADIKANNSDGLVTVQNSGSATLTWTSTNADSCTVTPGNFTGTSGSQVVGPITTQNTYTLTCQNEGGTKTDTVTVQPGTALDGSCTVSPSNNSAVVNQPVTWTGSGTGGLGSGSYTYDWTDSVGNSFRGNPFTKSYTTTGPRSANLTITSGVESKPISCPSVTIYDPTLQLDQHTASISFDGSIQLNALFDADGGGSLAQPQNVNASYGLIWSSANRSVATVSASGLVSGVAPGAVRITASYTDSFNNVRTDFADITVTAPLLQVSCSPDHATASSGEPIIWTATATGGVGGTTFIWKNSSGATIGTGQAITNTYTTSNQETETVTVTATSGSQTQSATCNATVHKPSFTITPSSVAVAIGATTPLAAIYNPLGNVNLAPDQTVTATAVWSSGDRAKATVDASGVVTGVYPTQTNAPVTITATYTDSFGNKWDGTQFAPATSQVTVTAPVLQVSCTLTDPVTGSAITSAITKQSINWNASATGGLGAGSYTYAWSDSDNVINGKTTSSASASYTNDGVKTATIAVTSGPYTQSITCPTLQVYKPTLTIAPSSVLLDFNGTSQLIAYFDPDGSGPQLTQTITANANWFSSATSTISVNNATQKGLVKGNNQGAAVITAYYTDSLGNVLSATANVAVNVPLLDATCSPDRTLASIGQQVRWTANPSGGTNSYTYIWSGTDSLSLTYQSIKFRSRTIVIPRRITSKSVSKIYETAGEKSASVTVTSGGQTKNVVCSPTVTIKQPSFNVAPSPASVPIGGTTQLNAIYNPYGDASLAPDQIVTAAAVWSSGDRTKATVDASGVITGVYPTQTNAPVTITATYTDSFGNKWDGTQSSPATSQVTVTAPPLSASCAPTDPLSGATLVNATTKQNILWTVARSGGTGQYTYNWTGDVTGTTQSVTNSYTAASPSPQTKTASVAVTSGIETQTPTCNVKVYDPTFVISPPQGAASQIPLNGTLQLVGLYNPYGPAGIVPDQDVASSPNTAWSSDNASIVHVDPAGLITGVASGVTAIRATYIDQYGNSKTATINITVTNAAPIAVAGISTDGINYFDTITVTHGIPVTIYLGANDSTDPNGWTNSGFGVSNGGKCEWNSDLNQGVPTFEPPAITSPQSPSHCNIALGTKTLNDTPGTYTYAVLKITDAAGAVSNVASVSVVVQPTPILDATCTVSPISAITKEPVTWTATATGGINTYSYNWSGDDGLNGTTNRVVTAYDNPGQKTASVTVTSGDQASGIQTKTVSQCSNLPNGITIYKPTLRIDPTATSTIVNRPVQLKAYFDPDGDGPRKEQNVTASADTRWTSPDATKAIVNNGTKKGEVTGIAATVPGAPVKIKTEYTDEFGNIVSNTSDVTVFQPTYTIVPSSVELGLTPTTQITQLSGRYDPDGTGPQHDIDVTLSAQWSSRNPLVAKVAANGARKGEVTAFTTGTAQIDSQYIDSAGNSFTPSATVIVNSNPHLDCSPKNKDAFFSETFNMRATGGDGSYSWSAPGATPSSGNTSGSAPFTIKYTLSGPKTITVTSGPPTEQQTAQCTVNVSNAPTLTIVAPTTHLTKNQRISLIALYDPDGNGPIPAYPVTQAATWGSNDPRVEVNEIGQDKGSVRGVEPTSSGAPKVNIAATSSNLFDKIWNGIVSMVSPVFAQTSGGAVVTATFTDQFGNTIQAVPLTLNVFQPTLVITPSAVVLQIGQKSQLQALYDQDGPAGTQFGDQPVTIDPHTNWTSLDPNKVLVDNLFSKGLITGRSDGNTNVNAEYIDPFGNDLSANANVTVTLAPFPAPVCLPLTQIIPVGQPASLAATGGTGSYHWAAPGGTPSTGGDPLFNPVYNEEGNYNVTLQSGNLTTACSVEVHLAVFNPTVVQPNQTVTLEAPSLGPATYTCTGNLGSGSMNGSVTFSTPPSDTQTCTVTETGGARRVTTATVIVSRPIRNFREVAPE